MANRRETAAADAGYVVVYATFRDEVSALEAGRALVEARLAGCINVLPGMTSVYVWQGRTETAKESVLIAKTRAGLAGAVVDSIKSGHSYETPAVLVLPVISGNDDYLAWLRSGTRPASDDSEAGT